MRLDKVGQNQGILGMEQKLPHQTEFLDPPFTHIYEIPSCLDLSMLLLMCNDIWACVNVSIN